jgi:hypothetical protein
MTASRTAEMTAAKNRIATADAFIDALTPAQIETCLWMIALDAVAGRIKTNDDVAATLAQALRLAATEAQEA